MTEVISKVRGCIAQVTFAPFGRTYFGEKTSSH